MFKNRLLLYIDMVTGIAQLADGVGVVTCFDPDRCYPDTPFFTTYSVTCEQEPLIQEK